MLGRRAERIRTENRFMKILHTSDWHLGKRLEGRDRTEEQREILADISRIAEEKACKIVLVAGDVFDVSLPPAEAERLYYDALLSLSAGGRLVLVVSGNHDDPARVSCAARVLEAHNVLVCSPEGFPEISALKHFQIASRTPRSLVLEGYGERVTVTGLCYPFSFAENSAERSYTDNLRALLDEDLTPKGRHILLTHLFAAGAKVSGDERAIEVGGARVADVSLFEGYDYVALGHIHRFQRVKNGCYPGSIAQYSFDERQEKGVVVYDTLDNTAEFVPLSAGRKLLRLSAEGVDLGIQALAAHAENFCELTLRLDRPLSFSENKLLKNFENLVSLKIELSEKREEGKSYRALRPDQLFSAFWEQRYGKAPEEEVIAEFLDLLEGGDDVTEEAAAAEDRV